MHSYMLGSGEMRHSRGGRQIEKGWGGEMLCEPRKTQALTLLQKLRKAGA